MNPYQEQETLSTLLIPSRFFKDYLEKTNIMGRKFYFYSLLKRYKPLLVKGCFLKKSRVKTIFQDVGENLVKVNFRPNNVDWLEFGTLADFLGVSRCALFSLLLALDINRWDLLIFSSWKPNNHTKNPFKLVTLGVPSATGVLTFSKYLQRGIQPLYKTKIRHHPPSWG